MCKFTTIILLCCTFSVFSAQVSAQNADIEILRAINSTTGLHSYSGFISKTTPVIGISVPLLMGTVALIERNDNLLKDAVYVGASIGVSTVLTYAFKHSVDRRRPYITYPDLIVDPAFYEPSASFPSNHTSFAFATATSLSLKYPVWYVITPSYLWACSVGYSRMNLGVHYPSDVLAGALLGAGSAFVTCKVNDWFWKKQQHRRLIGLQAYR